MAATAFVLATEVRLPVSFPARLRRPLGVGENGGVCSLTSDFFLVLW